jgi:hypothetical protein
MREWRIEVERKGRSRGCRIESGTSLGRKRGDMPVKQFHSILAEI